MSDLVNINILHRNIAVNDFQLELLRSESTLFPSINTEVDTIQMPSSTSAAVFFVKQDGSPKIIKTSIYQTDIKKYSFNHVLNECFIGYFGLNTLNSFNFAKIEGFQIAECPWNASDSEWNLYKDKTCIYTIYEYIPGVSFRDYLETASFDQIKSILLELFEALYQASTLLDFTHFDLHQENIIIHNDRPVIIDYGQSHIKYDNYDFGRINPRFHIYNKNVWYTDILCILFGLCEFLYSKYGSFDTLFADYQEYSSDYHFTTKPPPEIKKLRHSYFNHLDDAPLLYLYVRLLLSYFFDNYEIDPYTYMDQYEIYPNETMLLYGYNFKEFLDYVYNI